MGPKPGARPMSGMSRNWSVQEVTALVAIARAISDLVRMVAGLDDADARARRIRDRAARDLARDAVRAKRAAERVRLRQDRDG